MAELKIEYLPIEALKPYGKNARKHGQEDVDAIAASIEAFDFSDPIGVWGPDNEIVEGHGRVLAAKKQGIERVPVIRLDHLTKDEAKAYRLAHNRTAELSAWDFDAQAAELAELSDFDMAAFGFDLQSDPLVLEEEEERKGSLSDNFIFPPFSVLRGDSGPWMERKRLWNSYGIASGEGRGGTCV